MIGPAGPVRPGQPTGPRPKAGTTRQPPVAPIPRSPGWVFGAGPIPIDDTGAFDIYGATGFILASSGNVQTLTSATFTPVANTRMFVVARAGRANHLTAFSWTFSDSGAGSWATPATGPVEPNGANSFARNLAWSFQDVGASPTAITVTVDAWSTADIGAYALVVFFAPAGSTVAQVAYDFNNAGGTVTPTLAAAATNPVWCATFAEDGIGPGIYWDTPEAGYATLLQTVSGLYSARLTYSATGDTSGSTTSSYQGAPSTADAVLLELAPPVTPALPREPVISTVRTVTQRARGLVLRAPLPPVRRPPRPVTSSTGRVPRAQAGRGLILRAPQPPAQPTTAPPRPVLGPVRVVQARAQGLILRAPQPPVAATTPPPPRPVTSMARTVARVRTGIVLRTRVVPVTPTQPPPRPVLSNNRVGPRRPIVGLVLRAPRPTPARPRPPILSRRPAAPPTARRPVVLRAPQPPPAPTPRPARPVLGRVARLAQRTRSLIRSRPTGAPATGPALEIPVNHRARILPAPRHQAATVARHAVSFAPPRHAARLRPQPVIATSTSPTGPFNTTTELLASGLIPANQILAWMPHNVLATSKRDPNGWELGQGPDHTPNADGTDPFSIWYPNTDASAPYARAEYDFVFDPAAAFSGTGYLRQVLRNPYTSSFAAQTWRFNGQDGTPFGPTINTSFRVWFNEEITYDNTGPGGPSDSGFTNLYQIYRKSPANEPIITFGAGHNLQNDTRMRWSADLQQWAQFDVGLVATPTIPIQQWVHCDVLTTTDVSGAGGGRIQFWMDGQLIIDFTGSVMTDFWDRYGISLGVYGHLLGQNPITVRYDEVLITTGATTHQHLILPNRAGGWG